MEGEIRVQKSWHFIYYVIFGLVTVALLMFYLSDTIIHYTTDQQFPINSFHRFPLTWLIFPAEVFSFMFGLYFIYTLFTDRKRNKKPKPLPLKQRIKVAFLVPVYKEPTEVIDRTLAACNKVRWPGGTRTYLLVDNPDVENLKKMNALGKKHKCKVVTRESWEGKKAGNVNNGIRHHVKEPYFAIFDADQAPDPNFLEETMDFFSENSVGFVQTPQHLINEKTPLERAAKIGTNIFYHSMCVSKARDGAMAFCGTNAITRTDVFKKVGGFSYYTSTEDIELGVRINAAGYHGEYVPINLVHGYAPPDFKSYSTQQYRWANGNLAIGREVWLKLLTGNFSLRYLFHMAFTLGWWLIGLVTIAYITVPILSFFLGGTHHTWLPTWILMWIFFHVVLGVGIIFVSLQGRTEEKMTLRDAFLQYSLITNSMFIFAKAAINALILRRYISFVRTKKERSQGGWWLVKWNLLLGFICFSFSVYALFMASRAGDFQQFRTFFPISLWLLFYAVILASSVVFVSGPIEGGASQ